MSFTRTIRAACQIAPTTSCRCRFLTQPKPK
jgi:hypothetical protein